MRKTSISVVKVTGTRVPWPQDLVDDYDILKDYVIWVWRRGGVRSPIVFRWCQRESYWEGYALRLIPDDLLPEWYAVCAGHQETWLPTQAGVIMMHLEAYPQWFQDHWSEVARHSG